MSEVMRETQDARHLMSWLVSGSLHWEEGFALHSRRPTTRPPTSTTILLRRSGLYGHLIPDPLKQLSRVFHKQYWRVSSRKPLSFFPLYICFPFFLASSNFFFFSRSSFNVHFFARLLIKQRARKITDVNTFFFLSSWLAEGAILALSRMLLLSCMLFPEFCVVFPSNWWCAYCHQRDRERT